MLLAKVEKNKIIHVIVCIVVVLQKNVLLFIIIITVHCSFYYFFTFYLILKIFSTFFYFLFYNRLDFRPSRGIYDLQIKNTSYNRDNGRFECRIKAKGTGADVHQEFYNLTVLTPPHPPIISPGNIAVATEDKSLELTCSSIGGSPDPMIT